MANSDSKPMLSGASLATAAAIGATLAAPIFYKLHRRRQRHRGNFPSSTPWFLPSIDLLYAIRAGSIDKFIANRKLALNSDCFYTRFPGVGEALTITNPKDQAELLRKEGKLQLSVFMPDTVNHTHGPGNFQILSGEKHNFYRKIFASLLSPLALESFTPHLFEAFTNMWKDLEEQCHNSTDEYPVIIRDAICKTQFFLMAKILYGMTPENTSLDLLLQMRDDFEAQLHGHFAPLGSEKFKKAKEASKRLHEILGEKFNTVLETRRAILSSNRDGGEEKKEQNESNDKQMVGNAMETVADALLKDGVDCDPQVISDIIDNLDLLLEASHGTTMDVTTSILYYLNHPDNKEKLKKLRQDMKTFGSSLPSFEQLKNSMPYADAVIKETMRLSPIIVGVTYVVKDDIKFTFKGQALQGPINFNVSFGQDFLDAKLFPRPEEFVPERWIQGSDDYVSDAAMSVYKPFGAGRHICLGYKLATLVMKSSLFCFARDETRMIKFDSNKVCKKVDIFPAYSVSGGFPGRVINQSQAD